MTRDPRTDPRPSDVLRKGDLTRTVDWREDYIGWHGISIMFERVCSLKTWRRWARNAEVLAWGGEE